MISSILVGIFVSAVYGIGPPPPFTKHPTPTVTTSITSTSSIATATLRPPPIVTPSNSTNAPYDSHTIDVVYDALQMYVSIFPNEYRVLPDYARYAVPKIDPELFLFINEMDFNSLVAGASDFQSLFDGFAQVITSNTPANNGTVLLPCLQILEEILYPGQNYQVFAITLKFLQQISSAYGLPQPTYTLPLMDFKPIPVMPYNVSSIAGLIPSSNSSSLVKRQSGAGNDDASLNQSIEDGMRGTSINVVNTGTAAAQEFFKTLGEGTAGAVAANIENLLLHSFKNIRLPPKVGRLPVGLMAGTLVKALGQEFLKDLGISALKEELAMNVLISAYSATTAGAVFDKSQMRNLLPTKDFLVYGNELSGEIKEDFLISILGDTLKFSPETSQSWKDTPATGPDAKTLADAIAGWNREEAAKNSGSLANDWLNGAGEYSLTAENFYTQPEEIQFTLGNFDPKLKVITKAREFSRSKGVSAANGQAGVVESFKEALQQADLSDPNGADAQKLNEFADAVDTGNSDNQETLGLIDAGAEVLGGKTNIHPNLAKSIQKINNARNRMRNTAGLRSAFGQRR
ncbi:hypothetical protein HDV06_006588 [Boothiomyces sp. JEL0866]|nr:hypothetical protein HDV06_006588 [Boothiomyces sp. JEL0866]